MRRNWKRILSLLLTVAMVFTMNTSVFAGTYKVTTGEGEDATIDVVNSQGETISPSDMSDEAKAELKEYSEKQALSDVKALVKELVKEEKSVNVLAADDRAVWDAYAAANPTSANNLLAGRDEDDPGTITIYAFTNNDATKYFDANGAEVNYNPDEPGDYIVAGSNDGVQYDALVKDGDAYLKGEDKVTDTASDLAKFMATEKVAETEKTEESQGATFTSQSEPGDYGAQSADAFGEMGWTLVKNNGTAAVYDTDYSYDAANKKLLLSNNSTLVLIAAKGAKDITVDKFSGATPSKLTVSVDEAFTGVVKLTTAQASVAGTVSTSSNTYLFTNNLEKVDDVSTAGTFYVAKKGNKVPSDTVSVSADGYEDAAAIKFTESVLKVAGSNDDDDSEVTVVGGSDSKAWIVELDDGNKGKPYVLFVFYGEDKESVTDIKMLPVYQFATPTDNVSVSENNGNPIITATGFDFYLENAADSDYQGRVKANDDSIFKAALNKKSDKKAVFTVSGLESLTGYTPSVRRVSSNELSKDNNGVLYIPSEWKNGASPITTTFDADNVLKNVTFTVSGIGLTAAKLWIDDAALNNKYAVKAVVSTNKAAATIASLPADYYIDDIQDATNAAGAKVLKIAKGDFAPNTKYYVFVSVNNAAKTADWVGKSAPVAEFTTVKEYTVAFDSKTSVAETIPYRTNKPLSDYIKDQGAVLKVNGSISQGDAGAEAYAVFHGGSAYTALTPKYTITDATGKTAGSTEVGNFSASLYDTVKNTFTYKKTQKVSFNAVFDISSYDTAVAANAVKASKTIGYGKSKVLISVNDAVVDKDDHKLENGDITYRFIANDLEELTSTAETGIKLDMSDASKKAFGAFTLGGALGSTSVVSNNSYTPGHDIIVMNSNCTLVSFNNATGAKDEYAKFAKDDITFEPYTATKSDFYVKPSASDTYVVTPSVESVNVEYGVDSSVAANIEKFFTPEVSVSDNDLKKDDYTVDYVVLSTNEAVSTVSKNWTKYSAETLNFKDFDTGSTLYVYAKVNIKGMSDKDLFMSRKVTVNIVSRKVNLVFNDGGKVNTDVGIYRARSSADQQDSLTVTHWTKSTPTGAYAKVSANFADPGLVKIVPVNDNGFADDLQLKGADIISGNIVFDLSNVDQFTATDGVSANIASFTEPTDAFAKNYEIELAYGFIKVDGTGTYNVQFLAYDNGNVVLNSSYYISGTEGTLLNAIKNSGRYSAKELTDIEKEITAFDTTSLNAVLDNKQTKSNGWKVSKKTESSGTTSNETVDVGGVLTKTLNAKYNYIFTADIRKYLTDGETGLSIATIPDVTYDGRAHEIDDGIAASKTASKINDVDIVIYDEDGNDMDWSEMKEYFTFTFKNNKDASVIFNEDGSFRQFKSEKARPNVTIKGKGKYTGFNATVYFNILPIKLDKDWLDGLSDGYFIKNGKLSGGLKLNVAYDNWYYNKKTKQYDLKKTVKLKEYNAKSGKGDYQTILYRKSGNNWQRVGVGTVKDVQKLITVSGEYGIRLKGYNNFTGVTGFNNNNSFYDASYKFYVTDNPAYLLDNATINTKTAKYEELITTTKKTISGLDLISAKGVVAKGSKTPLVYGKDYVVSKLEEYKPGIKEWQPVDDVTTTTNAGVFRITIQGVKNGKYFGSKVSKKITVKGKKLNAKDLELVYRTVQNDSKTETAIPKDGIELPETGDIFLYAKNESLLKEGKYEVDNPDANNKGLSKTNYKFNFEPGSHIFRVYGLKEYGGTYVDLKYKMAAIDINNSLISISADKTGIFNAAGGAMPKLTVSFGKDKKTAVDLLYNEATNGTTGTMRALTDGQVMFDGQTLNFVTNGCTLSFTVKVAGNTKLGDQAKITLKGVGNMKGSKKDLTFTVAKKEVSGELPSYYKLTSVNSINDQYVKGNVKYGAVLSFVNDALVGSKDATAPKVDLYQTYFKYDKKNGVVLDAKQVKKNYYAAGATNAGNAVVISAGTLEGFDFKKNAQTDDNFYTYTTKGVIQSVTVSLNQGIDLVTLPGKTDNIIFTGAPYTISTNAYIRVKLNNGTELDPTQFDYSFTDNQAAGNAKLTIVLKNHTGKSTYAYGGATKVFTFKIAPIKNAVKL